MNNRINTDTDGEELLPEEDIEFERELAEQERAEQQKIIETRRRIAEEKRQREKAAREERDRRIAQDRLDLIKMKAGIADEEETIKEEHEEKRELTGKEKAANIWYHEKWWIILAMFGIAVVIFMIVDAATKVRPDLEILLICDNEFAYEEQRALLEDKLEQYVPDRNGDGKVKVSVINCALNDKKTDMTYNTNSQKFFANLQQGQIIMVITDSATEQELQELMVDDLPKQFPGNKYIDEQGLSLDFGFLAKDLNCDHLPKDTHLCLRRPVNTLDDTLEDMQKHYDEDFELFKAITEGLTGQAADENDTGLPAADDSTADTSASDTSSQ